MSIIEQVRTPTAAPPCSDCPLYFPHTVDLMHKNTLEMEATYSPETLVRCYQTTRCHIAEGNNLYSHGHDDFKIKPHLQKRYLICPLLQFCSSTRPVLTSSLHFRYHIYGAAPLHFRCKRQFLCSAARVHCLNPDRCRAKLLRDVEG